MAQAFLILFLFIVLKSQNGPKKIAEVNNLKS